MPNSDSKFKDHLLWNKKWENCVEKLTFVRLYKEIPYLQEIQHIYQVCRVELCSCEHTRPQNNWYPLFLLTPWIFFVWSMWCLKSVKKCNFKGHLHLVCSLSKKKLLELSACLVVKYFQDGLKCTLSFASDTMTKISLTFFMGWTSLVGEPVPFLDNRFCCAWGRLHVFLLSNSLQWWFRPPSIKYEMQF